jgi:hypothetical protein
MTYIGSWRFWLIIALALGTLACAGKRERREEARQERLERREQARQDRAERQQRTRAEREGRAADEPKVAQTQTARPQAAPAAAAGAAVTPALTPVSTAPTAAVTESKITFMRATSYGGNVAASVFDVTDSGEAKFIGIVRPWNKLVYPVKPGLYTFMVVSEAADFMQATVVGGKTYYALVTPRMGAWKARFSFKPVRADEIDGNQFAGWDRRTKLVTNTPTTQAWARDNAASVADKRDRYWPEWSSKSQSDKDAQTLRAEDGR